MFVVVLFVAAGNSLIDYEDRDIDKKAHPNRPIPSGKIKIEKVLRFSYLLFILSIIMCIFNNLENITRPYSLILLLFNITVMITYEKNLKERGIPGNLSISWLIASLFLFGAVSIIKLPLLIILFTVMAFLANFMRELVKDIEDIKGDRDIRHTAPIMHGVGPSSSLACISLTAAIFLSSLPYILRIVNIFYLFIVLIADVIFIYSMFLLYRKRIKACQNYAKIGMLISLVAFAAGVI